jgi:glycosyltransferase involved in cell wall biosynthesis
MERFIDLSLIIPIFNEEENILLLHERIKSVLEEQNFSYEVIYVDDGSTDNTIMLLQSIVAHDAQVKVVQLRRNFGQTAAIAAGVDHSCGEVLIFMDGDLQNDPVDIPRLLAKLNEGYDVVSGWRKNRQDAQLSRKLPSWLANRLIAKVTGVSLHDSGCTLKAFRWDVFQHIRLYGEMHRFLPAYAAIAGAKIAEIEVAHHPRQFGVSKYGISRTIRVLLDLLTVKMMGTYRTRPLHAFGIPGLLLLSLGLISGTTAIGQSMIQRSIRQSSAPNKLLPLLGLGFGLQCLMTGIIAELLTRVYYETQEKPIYVVKNIFPHTQLTIEKEEAA